MRLMNDYLEGRTDANEYRRTFFDFFNKRISIPDERASQIIQAAYGDADDYDPNVRLPYTIERPELNERVRHSLAKLAALGYSIRLPTELSLDDE